MDMKMRIIKKISLLSLVVLGFTFCDKVEEPYFKVPPKDIKTKALLEVFTGHLATNSPAVMDKVNTLKATYGDQLNVVVYHAGEEAAAEGNTYSTNYKTPGGDQLYTDFNVEQSATGMINRKGITSSEDWEEEIKKQIGQESKIDLAILDNYNLETRELSVSLETTILKRIDSTVHIAAYLVEEEQTSPQKFETGDSLEYAHKYIFRKAFNDAVYGSIEINEPEKHKTYSSTLATINIPSNWWEDRLHVVVVAYTGTGTSPVILHSEDILVDAEPPIERKRKILIDESTGHRCPNCPKGHEKIVGYKEQFGNQIISISYHSGPTALPYGEHFDGIDYRTPEGDEIVNEFVITSNPMATVNRMDFNETAPKKALTTNLWDDAVNTALSMDVEAGMRIKKKYDEATRKLDVNVTTEFYSDTISTPVWICTVVTESGIISPQLDPDGLVILEYEHNDMFRAPLNGTWGELLTNSAASEKKYKAKSSIELNPEWDAENISIVSFVYRADNKQIIQVEEIHLGNTH